MKAASIAAVTSILLTFMLGCESKTKTVSPQAQAPVLPPSQMVHIPNLPALPPPPLRDVAIAIPPPEAPEPARPRKIAHRRPSSAKPTAPADVAAQSGEKGTQPASTQAATGASTDASPIGQLSSSDEGSSSEGRQAIERLINDTENGLNGIKRALSGEEQDTSTQIRTFLTKARKALADNDLDGAQNLANKAKELLEELTKK